MYERPVLVNDQMYHVYNRGVAKQPIFHDWHDQQHFLDTLNFYLDDRPAKSLSKSSVDERKLVFAGFPEEPLVEILAYCLMPNHFHLILKQKTDGGVSRYMQQCLNSYARAYNTRYHRVGPLFQGRFSAVSIDNDEQFLQVTRYVHLNPFVAKLSPSPEYPWSSYASYLADKITRLCNPALALAIAGGPQRYRGFVQDYASYAQDLTIIKKHTLDAEE